MRAHRQPILADKTYMLHIIVICLALLEKIRNTELAHNHPGNISLVYPKRR